MFNLTVLDDDKSNDDADVKVLLLSLLDLYAAPAPAFGGLGMEFKVDTLAVDASVSSISSPHASSSSKSISARSVSSAIERPAKLGFSLENYSP